MTPTTIISDQEGERLDLYLSKKYPKYSRSYFIKLAKENKITVNKKVAKASFKLSVGDVIDIEFIEKLAEPDLKPEHIDLDIVYEDENVIVINKQPGLVVHPAANNFSGTLVNALLAHFPKISEAVYEKGNPLSESRPGLVHRIDKDTSGVLIIAKNSRAMHSLSRQLQHRTVKKIYLSLNYGWPENENGTLTNYLGRNPKDRKVVTEVGEATGRMAISDYRVLKYLTDKSGNKFSLIEFDIKTGRTHQIRTQSKMFKHPIIGDQTYYSKDSKKISDSLKINRQMLHAHKLTISLPGDDKQSTFTAKLPKDFENILNNLTQVD